MSAYLLLLALLLFGVVVENYIKRTPKRLYILTMIIMGVMFVFRYGQGTDYFGYKWIFSVIPSYSSIRELANININAEIGWRFLCLIAKKIGLRFESMVVVLSVVEWIGFSRFLRRFCPRKMLALLMAYHTFHLTYMYSALRQGLVLCLFVGFLLPWFMDGKYGRYIVGCLVCSLFHSSALVCILMLIFRLKVFPTTKKMILIVAACFSVGILLSTGTLNGFLKMVLPDRVQYYFQETSISVALIERIVMYGVVMFLYVLYCRDCVSKGEAADEVIVMFIKAYSLSAMLYGLLLWMPLVASRITYVYKLFEIPLLSMFAVKQTRFKRLVPLFVALFSLAMYVKNVDSNIDQGKYHDDVNVLNYPYVSLLEKEQIYKCRDIIYNFSD